MKSDCKAMRFISDLLQKNYLFSILLQFISSLKLIIWTTSGFVLLILVLAGHSPTILFLYQTPNFLPALGFRLFSLLLSLVLLGTFYGIGMLICPLMGLRVIPKYLEVPTRFFVGYIVASVVVYLLGFLGILHREILLIVVLFGVWITIQKTSCPPFNTLRPFNWFRLDRLEQWSLMIIGLFLIGRLFPVLNFNSFGDPLFYNLPAGRDYLQAGGFQWFDHAEFYSQAGLSEIGLIYLHSVTSHAMLVQLTAQAFYYLTGTLFLLYILH